jgi:zinc protease
MTPRRGLPLIAAVAMMVSAATAQDIKYEKYVLPNGMTIILHEDHSLPVATVNLWYHVGSKDENPHRSGFAHLFEHLMFMGTKRAPTGDFDKIMESGGGNNNASTTQDRTNFYDYGPSTLLPTLLWLEADRLEDLGRMMDQKKLDLQREVVKNERRENFENAPYGSVALKIDEAMYPDNHPYHIDTIGLPEDIDAATVKDVKDFFATFYVPNNATMVVAGDFEPKLVKPLIDKLFGTLPRMNDPIHKTAPEPALHEVKRLTLVDKVPQARTYIVWHSPAMYKPGDGELDLLAGVLSDGFASRLYQRLVVKDQLASDVVAEQDSQYLSSMFMIVATAKEGVSLDKVEAAIDDEVSKILATGPTQDELAREKSKYEFGSLSRLQDLADVADRMNQYDFFLGEPNSFKWDLERHTKPVPAEVQSWGKRVLDPNARLILRVVPESEKLGQNPRDQRPKITADKGFKLPTPTEFTLSNGLKGLYISRPELPLMSVAMMFKGGATSDTAAKSGLASLTAEMLDQGAGNLDAEAFSKAMDSLGASFGAGAGQTSLTVSLSSIAANFDKALPLFADAIIRPRFAQPDFERERSNRLDELAQEADDPEAVARIVAMREFFGPSHPYGRNPSGTEETVKVLTVADLKQEHDQILRPDNATLFVSGSLPLDQVKASLERQFGGWHAAEGKPVAAVPVPPPANRALRVLIVDKPQAVQTVIRFVFPGEPYASPNRVAIEAISTLLGGTFTSRLNANLREAKGYTYGASARSVFENALGYVTAASSVRADVTGASVQEFLNEFANLRTGDIKDEEALKARASMRTDTIASLESVGGLVGTLEALHVHGQTMDDLARELLSYSEITAAKLNPLAKQSVSLDNAVLVLVGDKDLILKQIAGLKLPKPDIVSGMK